MDQSGRATGLVTTMAAATATGVPKNIFDLPAFVTLRGGGYYFIPSISALRFIAGQSY